MQTHRDLPRAALVLLFVGLPFAAACSSSDTTGAGGSGGHAATTSAGGAGGAGGAIPSTGESVLQHHNSPTRNGVYTQPSMTPQTAAAMHRDPAFSPTTQGATYAQPLFVDGEMTGPDKLIVATEANFVYALDAATGAEIWSKSLGAAVKLSSLPCGNIDPLGITGTPVIDASSKALFVDAMTTPDGGTTKKHLIFGLSLTDGSVLPGYPIDVGATATAGGLTFDSAVQNQRGALLIVDGTLYVPYGGHYGDCGQFHGWVVAVPLANPSAVQAWATSAQGGGAWAPGGVSSDGTSMYVATGNTFGASTWGGGESVIRLGKAATFSGVPSDYFAPLDWMSLDAGDVDIGGTAPMIFDLDGAKPSKIAVALGKNGKAYVLDRTNLGGVSNAPVSAKVSSGEIINAAAAYPAADGMFVAFNGPGSGCPNGAGDLVALKIGVASPPTLTIAWCANEHGSGSPMVTTTDGHSGPIVWTLGVEGDSKLHGYDGATGAELFNGGSDVMTGLKHFATPIAAKGRIFAAGTSSVYAFTAK